MTSLQPKTGWQDLRRAFCRLCLLRSWRDAKQSFSLKTLSWLEINILEGNKLCIKILDILWTYLLVNLKCEAFTAYLEQLMRTSSTCEVGRSQNVEKLWMILVHFDALCALYLQLFHILQLAAYQCSLRSVLCILFLGDRQYMFFGRFQIWFLFSCPQTAQ